MTDSTQPKLDEAFGKPDMAISDNIMHKFSTVDAEFCIDADLSTKTKARNHVMTLLLDNKDNLREVDLSGLFKDHIKGKPKSSECKRTSETITLPPSKKHSSVTTNNEKDVIYLEVDNQDDNEDDSDILAGKSRNDSSTPPTKKNRAKHPRFQVKGMEGYLEKLEEYDSQIHKTPVDGNKKPPAILTPTGTPERELRAEPKGKCNEIAINKFMKQVLPKMVGLSHLKLNNNCVTNEHLKNLVGVATQDVPFLRSLEVSSANLDGNCFECFSNFLKTKPLRFLRINADAQHSNQTRINQDMVCRLLEMLKDNNKLEELYVRTTKNTNSLLIEGLTEFIKHKEKVGGVHTLRVIEIVPVSGTVKLNVQCLSELKDACMGCANLKTLTLSRHLSKLTKAMLNFNNAEFGSDKKVVTEMLGDDTKYLKPTSPSDYYEIITTPTNAEPGTCLPGSVYVKPWIDQQLDIRF